MSRHGVVGKRLGRNVGHRRALLKNLATSVIVQGLNEEPMQRQVTTTITKAKEIRRVVERLITYAKQGDLAARRQAARIVTTPVALQGLFDVLGKRYSKRSGGYTRVLRLGTPRHGDSSEMAIISLVEEEITPKTRKSAPRASGAAKKPKSDKKVDITKSEEKAAASAEAAPAADKPEA